MCYSTVKSAEERSKGGGDDSATGGVDLEAIDLYVCVLTGFRDGTYD